MLTYDFMCSLENRILLKETINFTHIFSSYEYQSSRMNYQTSNE